MTTKVETAVFDRDLKAREFKKFELTDDGSKIRIRSGGKRNFNPTLDNDSFIELPFRSLLTLWKISWRRIYFVRNGARACVRFRKKPSLLSREIKTIEDLQKLILKATADKDADPEAKQKLEELFTILETTDADDFLIPDIEEVMRAARNEMLEKLGQDKQETPMILYIILAVNIFIALSYLGVV